MSPIHFQAIVGPEQVIRPPSGVSLPLGPIEVIVNMPEEEKHANDDLQPMREWLLGLASEAEQAAPDLPSDLAEYHDHYAHGKPRS
jgi:hypothetical protein